MMDTMMLGIGLTMIGLGMIQLGTAAALIISRRQLREELN